VSNRPDSARGLHVRYFCLVVKQLDTKAGPWRLEREIARGGSGEVYLATHVKTGARVVVKMLDPAVSRVSDARARFEREARLMSEMAHPGIARAHDLGRLDDGRPFFTMELLPGETLAQALRRQRFSVRDVASIGAQLADAMAAVHEKGIVHRDLKPDNIFVGPAGSDGYDVKIVDFGLAKPLATPEDPNPFPGALAYSAPEFVLGQASVAPAADVYSLGCTLFELACGSPPFAGSGSVARWVYAHIKEPPPAPRALDKNVPDALSELIVAMLGKEPSGRPSMRDVAQRLREMRNSFAAEAAQGISVGEEPSVRSLLSPGHAHAPTAAQVLKELEDNLLSSDGPAALMKESPKATPHLWIRDHSRAIVVVSAVALCSVGAYAAAGPAYAVVFLGLLVAGALGGIFVRRLGERRRERTG
jgi:eukaryotic-like serine/threonine-protein kinase